MKRYLTMTPIELKDYLSQFISPSCDFYSRQAEEVIRKELEKRRGIGPITAYNIYMRAVNGTYDGPEMKGPFAPLPF